MPLGITSRVICLAGMFCVYRGLVTVPVCPGAGGWGGCEVLEPEFAQHTQAHAHPKEQEAGSCALTHSWGGHAHGTLLCQARAELLCLTPAEPCCRQLGRANN